MSFYTDKWEDGTPRSQSNAFAWQSPEILAEKSAKEAEREAWRQSYQRRKAREAATRVNPESNIAYSSGPTKSERAPR
jgi:hypothetical protein